ncbi:MAG: TolC family protein [Paludibacter sp.]|nr:TolC family protein [Paludibacter sp.]
MSENPTIKVADKEIERVDYSKKERIAGLFPTISASAAYQRALKKQRMFLPFSIIPGTPPDPAGIEIGVDNTINTGVSASLPIISPTLWASIEMTELDAMLALESARSSKLSLINQVTKTYYGVLMAQDSYNVLKKSYDNTVENARIVKNKFEQGQVSEYDWIRADVQVRNVKSNVVSAESGVNLSKLQLKMLMGMDMTVTIKVEGTLSDFEANLYGDVLSIDTTTLKTNTDMNQFDLKSKQLDHSLKMQKAGWWPTLAASFNYQYMTMANDKVAFTWFPTSSASVSLSIPIFQGGARIYKQKQIKIQQDELKYQRENLQRNLELQAITYLDNIKKAIEKIESNKEGMRQADKAMMISQKRYDVGLGTYLDLTNSEISYIQAGLSYNQSIYDYLSAKSDLEKLLGKDSK